MAIVETLLEHGAAVDPIDSHGNTPLSECITSTYPLNLAVVDLLLAHGADPRCKNYYDSSPIDVARRTGKLDLAQRFDQ